MRYPGIEAIAAKPRCHARSKQTGRRCRQPVVGERSVCAYHGGHGGAPKGTLSRFENGNRTLEAEMMRATGKGLRIASKVLTKVISKTARGKLSPAVGLSAAKGIGEIISATSEARDLASRSLEQRRGLAQERKARKLLVPEK